jgi:hypothetical protein
MGIPHAGLKSSEPKGVEKEDKMLIKIPIQLFNTFHHSLPLHPLACVSSSLSLRARVKS